MNDDVTTQTPPSSYLMPDIEPSAPLARQDRVPAGADTPRRPQVVQLLDEPQRISPIFRSSPELGEFYAALAAAQATEGYGDIERTRKARIATRTGGSYEIEYETMADVLAATRPMLAANKIAVQQFPASSRVGQSTVITILTRLGHSSGQWVENQLTCVVASPAPQDMAIGITYMCRYALKAICGVAANWDDDEAQLAQTRAQGQGGRPQPTPRKSEQQPAQTERAQAQDEARQAAPKGKIKQVLERGGGWLVELESGFWFSTRDKDQVALLWAAKNDDELVTAETRPSSDPAKYPPVLVKFTSAHVDGR